jgi:hypothetical protein
MMSWTPFSLPTPPPAPRHRNPKIDYKGKGYFTGKAHSYKATLTKSGHSSTLQTYEGQWTGVSTVGGSKSSTVFLDTSSPKEEVMVKGVTEQGEWESRRLWEKVAKGIRGGLYDQAAVEKTRIEVS